MRIKSKITGKINGLIRHGQWFREVAFRDAVKMVNHCEFDLDVVNLGSSSGVYSFDYTDLNIRCANWALRPNSLLADHEILNNYYSYLKHQGATVLIPLCPFSFLSGSYCYFDDRYYTFLQLRSIPNGNWKHQLEVKDKYQKPICQYPLMAIWTDLKALVRKPKPLAPEDFPANAKKWMEGWLHEFSLETIDEPLSLVNRDNIADGKEILTHTICYCQERGIRPVLVIPPISKALLEELPVEYRHSFMLAHIDDVVRQTNVEFINYMDDPQFTKEPTLFRDSFFLNEKGAKLFTRRVLSDLGIIGKEEMSNKPRVITPPIRN